MTRRKQERVTFSVEEETVKMDLHVVASESKLKR